MAVHPPRYVCMIFKMNKAKLHYSIGEEIRVGDVVQYNDSLGKTFFVVNTDSYASKFPKDEWDYLRGRIGRSQVSD